MSDIKRTLYSLLGNSQRLDGGAMFGNAPKALWTRWITPDEQNRIPLACRCLLVKEESPSLKKTRYILCETGIGAFFSPKMRERFGVQEEQHVLLESLANIGLSPEDIDIIILSHLHFDHAGGLLSAWSADQNYTLAFPKARFIVGERALARARQPHPRDRASFIPELLELLEESQALEVIPSGGQSELLGADYDFHESDGHTPGQLLVEIKGQKERIIFCGDLIPGAPWVHLPITMGYDRFPELLIEEKEKLLSSLLGQSARLFFTHDSQYASAEIIQDQRGRFVAKNPIPQLEAWVL